MQGMQNGHFKKNHFKKSKENKQAKDKNRNKDEKRIRAGTEIKVKAEKE